MKMSFEETTCGRCNGNGRIKAFSLVYGGVCFGCGGHGTKLTRNGAAAKRRITKMLKERIGTPEEAMAILKNMKGVTITD